MAACCLYGAFILSMFLRKYELFQSHQLSDKLDGPTEKDIALTGSYISTERVDIFDITGMSCSNCVESIESNLSQRQGIKRANVDFLLAQAEIAYSRTQISRAEILEGLQATGFSATYKDRNVTARDARNGLGAWNWGQAFTWSLFLLLPILVLENLPSTLLAARTRQLYVLILGAVVQFGFGIPFHRHSVLAIKNSGFRKLPMDVLVSLSTLVTYCTSCYFYIKRERENYGATSAGLIIAITFSKHLESRLKASVTEGVRAFTNMVPSHARLFDTHETIPVRMLREGDVVYVDAGARFPCDGTLISPSTAQYAALLEIDESFHTGESIHVIKEVGDLCLAGTTNSESLPALIQVGEGATHRLAEIMETLIKAQRYKSETQLLVERLAAFTVPATIILSLLSFTFWLPTGFDQALRFMTATLVVACPCALSLSSPAAVLLGSSTGTEYGVMIKRGAQAVEALSKITTVFLDKTGTITTGLMNVTGHRIQGSWSEQEWWQLIHAAEHRSQHWVADSTSKHLTAIFGKIELGELLSTIQDKEVSPGGGVKCAVNKHCVIVGNRRHLELNAVTKTSAMEEDLKALRPWESYIMVAIDGIYSGIVTFADEVAKEACSTITALKALNYNVCMVTGDRHEVAAEVAKAVGIDKFWAELSPNEKMDRVYQAKADHQVVAMVGDGVNDAPALAAADVGIALHSGSPVALASADIVLLHSSIAQLIPTVDLAKTVYSTIKANIAWACVYNAILVPAAMGFLQPLGIVLHPTLAGILMMSSSVGVCYNSLRLKDRLHFIFQR